MVLNDLQINFKMSAYVAARRPPGRHAWLPLKEQAGSAYDGRIVRMSLTSCERGGNTFSVNVFHALDL